MAVAVESIAGRAIRRDGATTARSVATRRDWVQGGSTAGMVVRVVLVQVHGVVVGVPGRHQVARCCRIGDAGRR